MLTRPHQKLFLLNNYCTSTKENCPLLAARLWRRSSQITHAASEAPLPPVTSEPGEGAVKQRQVMENQRSGDSREERAVG